MNEIFRKEIHNVNVLIYTTIITKLVANLSPIFLKQTNNRKQHSNEQNHAKTTTIITYILVVFFCVPSCVEKVI